MTPGVCRILKGTAAEIDARHSRGQAVAVRIVDVVTRGPLPGDSLGPRGHLHGIGGKILGEIEVVALNETPIAVIDTALGCPDAGEVEPTIGELGRWSR